ncbi:MAG: hypothetical protein H0V70_23000 [Ktedonobacteraceae bacterium]|nr:hypothetical protein [Ktedonobacteraceae bacterium]
MSSSFALLVPASLGATASRHAPVCSAHANALTRLLVPSSPLAHSSICQTAPLAPRCALWSLLFFPRAWCPRDMPTRPCARTYRRATFSPVITCSPSVPRYLLPLSLFAPCALRPSLVLCFSVLWLTPHAPRHKREHPF